MGKTPAPSGPIPHHVAIIMDGNGRWAQARGLPRLAGHHEGAKAVRRAVTYAREIGVRYLTLYAFSTENWRRPEAEVGGLMKLLRDYLRSELETMLDNGVRLNVIGSTEQLPDFVCDVLADTQRATADEQGMTLTLALSYGGREELVRAVRGVVEEVQDGALDVDEIDKDAVARHLDTAGMPDPDLLIRTSGERRISNFMLWQIAYTELIMLPIAWPEFDAQHFHDAIVDYQRRERRYGMTGDQVQQVAGSGKNP